MNTITEAAIAEFNRAVDRLKKGLETTPDDRINWSPSESARTPIDVVAHCAMSINGIQGWLEGKPFPYKDLPDLDRHSREEEAKFTSRDAVLNVLEENGKNYTNWMCGLSEEQLGGQFETGFGVFPMSDAITFVADHLRGHAAQLEYIQTIYGDRGFHMSD